MVSTEPPASPWDRLRVVLEPERADLWIVLVYGLAVAGLSLTVPIATQALVTWAAFGTVLQPVVALGAIITGLLILAGGLRAIQVWVTELVQQRIFARMAVDIAWRLPRARLEGFGAHRPTELVNRFMDVMTIRKATALILLDGFALVLQALFGVILLAFYSPLLLGYALLLLASMAFVVFGLGLGAIRTSIAESRAKYDVLAWLEEVARVPRAFRDPLDARQALERADRGTLDYLSRRKAHFRILFRQLLGAYAVQALASGSLLGLGGWLITRQQLTIGQLVAAELVVGPLVASFAGAGKYLETVYDLLAAVEKVGMLFDVPLEREQGEPLPETTAPLRVRVHGLMWSRSDGQPLFTDVELTLEPGSRTVLRGASGSGKSTLLDVLTAHVAPARGAVEFDGVDARELALPSLRSRVRLVRGIDLFDGTLLDNVRLGQNVGLKEVRELLEQLGLSEAISSLPAGLNTELTGGVTPFSTGEAHRIMIARAVLSRPRLLVIDEALDDMDAESRSRCLELLLSAAAPWTLIVATHGTDQLARFDQVVTLGRGRLTLETVAP